MPGRSRFFQKVRCLRTLAHRGVLSLPMKINLAYFKIATPIQHIVIGLTGRPLIVKSSPPKNLRLRRGHRRRRSAKLVVVGRLRGLVGRLRGFVGSSRPVINTVISAPHSDGGAPMAAGNTMAGSNITAGVSTGVNTID
jgi:hypothetical protein